MHFINYIAGCKSRHSIVLMARFKLAVIVVPFLAKCHAFPKMQAVAASTKAEQLMLNPQELY